MASPPPESDLEVPTSPTFPHELVPITQRKAYRAAAANARQQRRRKVLSKRGLWRDTPAEISVSRTPSNAMASSDIISPSETMNTSPIQLNAGSRIDRILSSSVIVSPPGKRQRCGSFSSSSRILKIAPDLKGIREMCVRLQEHRETVAIPTECTYEMMQPFHLRSIPPLSTVVQVPPHVYIPNVSIFETSSFWKRMFPKKSYALKQRKSLAFASSTTIHSPPPPTITRFNESMQVVRRLALHFWPGPILLYVQVPHPIPGVTITRASLNAQESFTDTSEVQHYLALRNPCHPLSLKVCQEFYSTINNASENDGSCSSCSASPKLGSTSPLSALPPICRIASCESISSAKTSSSSLSGLAPMEESVMRLSTSSCLLVGRPIRCGQPLEGNDDEDVAVSGTDYARNADQVLFSEKFAKKGSDIQAVLDGEAHTEMISVPTCGWQRPYPVALWIDADARVVRLRRTVIQSHLHPDGRAMSPHSTLSAIPEFQYPSSDGDVMISDARRVLQALRAVEPITVPFLCGVTTLARHRSLKDRIQQAVLLKWKVVTE